MTADTAALHRFRVRYIYRHKGRVCSILLWAQNRKHAIAIKTGDGCRVVSCVPAPSDRSPS